MSPLTLRPAGVARKTTVAADVFRRGQVPDPRREVGPAVAGLDPPLVRGVDPTGGDHVAGDPLEQALDGDLPGQAPEARPC